LVDLIFVLAIINLFMELINVGIVWYFPYKLSKMDIILGKKKKEYIFNSLFLIERINVYFNINYN